MLRKTRVARRKAEKLRAQAERHIAEAALALDPEQFVDCRFCEAPAIGEVDNAPLCHEHLIRVARKIAGE